MDHSKHATATEGRALTRLALSTTLHYLTGSAIGEVLGMVIGTALEWTDLQTVALAVGLAFLFGYAFTIGPVMRSGLALRAAVPVALTASTASITVMEIVDNAVMLLVPGAMDAGLASPLFWGALAFALAVALVVTVPVNRWLITRGRGHAVVHRYHQPSEQDASAGHADTPATARDAALTRHDGDRAARQSANLARHLNDQHPGTVLLLARHAPDGRPDATAAELTAADDDHLTVAVTVPDGSADLRLALPDGPDVRSRIGALLRATRAGLPDTVPLTSLEEQLAGGRRGPHGSAAQR